MTRVNDVARSLATGRLHPVGRVGAEWRLDCPCGNSVVVYAQGHASLAQCATCQVVYAVLP